MGRVVVRRPAGEPEPARHRERPCVAAHGTDEAEGVHRELDGCGEARVEVEAGDVVDAVARGAERGAPGDPDRRCCGEMLALGEEVVIVGIRTGEREDHLVRWHAVGDCRAVRAQEHRRRLVDVDVGAHPLGVGERHHAVLGGDRADLLGRPRDA